MKFCLPLIFFFALLKVNAQVADDFNDGDFTTAPAWIGDTTDFNVNSSGQLQLQADSAGNSSLSVASNLISLDNSEWRFFIRLNFSPSTSNYCRVYLSLDQPDPSLPVDGYFLQFGESLSNDAIELFRQSGTSIVPICRATDGMIAGSFGVGVRVQRDQSGIWKLSVDYSGGSNYLLEATGSDATYNNSSFLGISCVYTSGNISKFYFDDFYVGPQIADTIPPDVTSVDVVSDSVLLVEFSEPIDGGSLHDLNNYLVDPGIGHPIFVWLDSLHANKFNLQVGIKFQPGVSYSIFFSGLLDLAGNAMVVQSFSFQYSPVAQAMPDDVVFTEIYFETSSVSPLPEGEYIEIYNRKDSAIQLTGWVVSDGSSDGLIPTVRLEPHGYAVLCSLSDSVEFNPIPNAIVLPSFPTLNNSGDHLVLYDSNEIPINEITFDESFYRDANRDGGGWSIERIDPDFTCDDANNWRASIANQHGTPGAENSVDGNFIDTTLPNALSAYWKDSITLEVITSEPIFNASDVNYFIATTVDGTLLLLDHVEVCPTSDTIHLRFRSPVASGIHTLVVSPEVRDCSGNSFQSSPKIRFGYSGIAESNDIIINEILFHSYDGGNDFLEIYNRSQKTIDLKDFIVIEANPEDTMDIRESALVTEGHLLIFPGDYLVLSENSEQVKAFYHYENPFAFQNVKSFPEFSNDRGIVKLCDGSGNVIDQFSYDEEMHFPLISEPRGVSLERLSKEELSGEKFNWHSAAATAGFATPGYGNSQRLIVASGSDEVSVELEVFSPDDDGYNDVLPIHYRFPQNGTLLSLSIFDYNGMLVRNLLNGRTVANEGMIVWDGLTDDRSIVSAGIYIVFARSFDLDGNDRVFKKSCFLTRKY